MFVGRGSSSPAPPGSIRPRNCSETGGYIPGVQRLILTAAAVLLGFSAGAGTNRDPVEWSAAVVDRAGSILTVEARPAIERGWYIYGMRQPADGPSPLRFAVSPREALPTGPAVGYGARTSYDSGFRMRVTKYTTSPRFHIPLRPRAGLERLALAIRYQACNDQVCLPPRSTTVVVPIADSATP